LRILHQRSTDALLAAISHGFHLSTWMARNFERLAGAGQRTRHRIAFNASDPYGQVCSSQTPTVGTKAPPARRESGLHASFSSNGRWIIFTSERAGSADIYRVHPDGSGLERLTSDPAYEDQAALSPDGSTLAFSPRAEAGWRISGTDLATISSAI